MAAARSRGSRVSCLRLTCGSVPGVALSGVSSGCRGSGSGLTPARLHSVHVTHVAASCLNPPDQQQEEEEEVSALCAN